MFSLLLPWLLRQVSNAAMYEHRMQQGSKAIFHLEAFVAKFMSLYKTWTLSMME